MIAHAAGVPVEELFLPILFGAGALCSGVGALISHWRHKRDASSLEPERSHELDRNRKVEISR
jgi:hypothetical protein